MHYDPTKPVAFDYKTSLTVDDGKIYQNYAQDLTPYVEFAKAMRDDTDIAHRKRQDIWHVASIPVSIVIDMLEKHKFDIYTGSAERLKQLLDDHYPFLKTMPGPLKRRK